ncbi:MAG: tRNA (5-methylaminomethyl-2-thiouridine)(34)-methyltransferase MnmD [Cytophagaceae bacterium]|jgi:tRNA U34 5-methylaminomethyl-2-thiouridine-forming methyltransferase MnmC|nr:tRNA (5-methylaminomethyl-2-thiouridine)(34)-methyltransferase MnmD [Cytophagaceae bacterium]
MDIEVITTGDGSHTLFLPGLQETYHSTHGAMQESKHVFLQHGLHALPPETRPVRLLEIGFGTGLNAWLSALTEKEIHYTTLELYPLEERIWKALNYASAEGQDIFEKIHTCKWENPCMVRPGFYLEKKQGDVKLLDLSNYLFDLVYFDAFAPSKQPEMWSSEIFEKIKSSLSKGSILVSYCASGAFKRTLKNLGFEVETLEGPPGKKEMTRAWLR